MDTLYTFWQNITHYKTKSVHFLELMNSATKSRVWFSTGRSTLLKIVMVVSIVAADTGVVMISI